MHQPKIARTLILPAAAIVCVGSNFIVAAGKKKITKEKAIRAAEQLIAKNGCSDLLPVKQRRRVEMNNEDFKTALDHELQCRAFAVYPSGPNNSGWSVLFRLRYHSCPECDQSNNWRAVTMDEYGREIRLEAGPFHPNPSKQSG